MKGQECGRGEFITTYHEIIKAASYYRNKAHIVPPLKQIRIILRWFEMQDTIRVEAIKSNFLIGADPRADIGADPKKRTRAYLGIKIIVLNYDLYQNPETYKGRPQEENKGRHRGRPSVQQGHINTNKENKGIKNPPEISDEISVLVSKLFPNGRRELFDQAIEAISSTRKSGKVKNTVILSMLKDWEKYPPEQVERGIKTYLEKAYHLESKREEYLLGIIRNQKDPLPLKNGYPEKSSTKKGQDLLSARRREMEAAAAVPCPPDLRPDFVKERKT